MMAVTFRLIAYFCVALFAWGPAFAAVAELAMMLAFAIGFMAAEARSLHDEAERHGG